MAKARPIYRRVVLTGFMGAGKTTVGRLLAPLLGWRFLDADHVLTERTGLLIPELFERHREVGFRALEAEVVESLLTETKIVLALGGGALEHAETRQRVTRDRGSAACVPDRAAGDFPFAMHERERRQGEAAAA